MHVSDSLSGYRRLLGLDTPSVASLKEGDFQELQAVHQALLNAKIVIVEALANLAELSGVGYHTRIVSVAKA